MAAAATAGKSATTVRARHLSSTPTPTALTPPGTANAEGIKWQNVTAARTNATDWTWALSGTQTWRDIKFRGDSPAVTTSHRDFSSLTGQMMKPVLSMYRVNFLGISAQAWRMGFAYGPIARAAPITPPPTCGARPVTAPCPSPRSTCAPS